MLALKSKAHVGLNVDNMTCRVRREIGAGSSRRYTPNLRPSELKSQRFDV